MGEKARAARPLAVAPGVWAFRSQGFAGLLSTLISLGEEALLVDPPMFREEASGIRAFARAQGLEITWLAITHAHGDHAYGMAHFPEALVIAQREFWPFWERTAPGEADYFARALAGFRAPPLRPPHVTFAEELAPDLGRKLLLRHTPGHSPDGLLVELPGERVWICGDTVIPIPYLASGDREELLATLRGLLGRWQGETIVLGHEQVLSGEGARGMIECNIRYLERLKERVAAAIKRGKSRREILEIPLFEFGLSPDALSGLAGELHRVNLDRVYRELSEGK